MIHIIYIYIYIYASFQITFFLSSEVRFFQIGWKGSSKKFVANLDGFAGSLQHIRIQMIILLGLSAHGPFVTAVRWLRLPKFGEFSWVEWVGGTMKPAIVRTSRCFFLSRRYIYIYNIQRGDVL